MVRSDKPTNPQMTRPFGVREYISGHASRAPFTTYLANRLRIDRGPREHTDPTTSEPTLNEMAEAGVEAWAAIAGR